MAEDIIYIKLLLPAATKLGQGNIFTGICLSTGGVCLSACWDIPPPTPGAEEQTPPWTRQTPRPGRHPPRSRHPPDQADPPRPGTPQEQTPWTRQNPPRPGKPPSWEADFSIRSTSGRYASYWNAFLLSEKMLYSLHKNNAMI